MVHVLDRKKRKTILFSTRFLPRPVRVAARVPLLERHELGKALRARCFIIGHPKSGNTWLRTMISRLYQTRYGLPDDLLLKSDELAHCDPEIPRFLVTNGHYSYESVILREMAARFSDRLVVMLARNPCDIAVSWYIQFTKRVSPAKRELINATLENPVDHETISQWEFVMHPEIGLPGIIRYLNRSYEVVSKMEHSMISNYESLRSNTIEELGRILNFFELDFSPEEIQNAVDYTSFENLKKLDSTGMFKRGGLKLRNPETPKVRRGKINGYLGDFEPDKIRQMEDLVVRDLVPELGYGRTSESEQVPTGV